MSIQPADAKATSNGDVQERTLCPQIEIDLSAMIDGELDPASVRRVLVHSDMCPSCRGFLDGIRTQMRAHRDLEEVGSLDGHAVDFAGVGSVGTDALREQLMQNRQQLARILYELGRGYVLMGMSPGFSRLVEREPVPIPDMSLRGRHLLDEVARLTSGSAGAEWMRARDLFGGELRTPQENMARGKRLLNEALMLRPDFHEARIYLGHAYHVSEERDHARREFRTVLETSTDPINRAFALENLGNVYLEEGRHHESIPLFEELVSSGVVATESRFFTAYFNLALAYGLLARFEDSRVWLRRLYDDYPHKRRLIADELRNRAQLLDTLKGHPEVRQSFAEDFPGWFPSSTEVC